MKTPHEHADVIKAWADGAEIEFWCVPADEWKTASSPQWNHGDSYRIKPEPWEKFCDSNCVLTDHHPDCKLAQQQQEQDGCPTCGSDVHDRDALDKAEREIERLNALVAQPQQEPAYDPWRNVTPSEQPARQTLCCAIEAQLKEKNT